MGCIRRYTINGRNLASINTDISVLHFFIDPSGGHVLAVFYEDLEYAQRDIEDYYRSTWGIG